MYALTAASATNLFIGDWAAEILLLDELAMLAEEKNATLWRVHEKCLRGGLLTMTGNHSNAVSNAHLGHYRYEVNRRDNVDPPLFAVACAR